MNDKKECTFFWFIENYSYCLYKSGKKLVSPAFTIDGLNGTSWTLGLYPRGDKDMYKNHIYVTLCRSKDDGPDFFLVNFILSILGRDESDLFSRKFENNFSKQTETGWYFYKINDILEENQAKYLPSDVLTVRCKFWFGTGNLTRVAPICARTRIGIEKISYIHAIKGFSEPEPNLKPLQIQSRSKNGCIISSGLYFTDGVCCDKKLVFEIAASSNDHVLAKCRISLLDINGEIIKCGEADNRFNVTRTEIRKFTLFLDKDSIINKKSEYLPNDTLSLLCDCTFSTRIEFQQIEGSQLKTTTTAPKLVSNNPYIQDANMYTEKLEVCASVVDDIKDIYSRKFLTDVELKTNKNSFLAHKIVLCARSPVFKAMMGNDMKEKNTNSIQVDDLEDVTVQQLLLFIYSDDLGDLQWENATKLYYAADKYQIEKLKLICSSFLTENLTVSNATELLLLADTHSDIDLKKVVEDFIFEHERLVFSSEKWEKLMEKNPQLAAQTMQLKYKIRK